MKQTKFDTKTVSSLSVEIGPFMQFTAVQCAVAVRKGMVCVLLFYCFCFENLCSVCLKTCSQSTSAEVTSDSVWWKFQATQQSSGQTTSRNYCHRKTDHCHSLGSQYSCCSYFHRKRMKMARKVKSLGQPARRPHLSCWIVKAFVKILKLNIQIWHIECVMTTEG